MATAFTRRRVIAGLLLGATLPAWRPLWAAEATPRVVSLSWELTEHLLGLGLPPAAAADPGDYRTWVARPTLPATVLDAGARTEPNLEVIARLQPDAILITPYLDGLAPRLAAIAPVSRYQDYTPVQDNFQVQRDNLLRLAAQLGHAERGRRLLAELDARLARSRQALAQRFAGRPPPVAVIRFASPTITYLFGTNSLPWHALRQLGLEPALEVPPSRFGSVQRPLTELGRIDRGVVLYLEPFRQQAQLFDSALWQAMPFVRNGRLASLGTLWTHGGVLCVGYLADAISQALLALPQADASVV